MFCIWNCERRGELREDLIKLNGLRQSLRFVQNYSGPSILDREGKTALLHSNIVAYEQSVIDLQYIIDHACAKCRTQDRYTNRTSSSARNGNKRFR